MLGLRRISYSMALVVMVFAIAGTASAEPSKPAPPPPVPLVPGGVPNNPGSVGTTQNGNDVGVTATSPGNSASNPKPGGNNPGQPGSTEPPKWTQDSDGVWRDKDGYAPVVNPNDCTQRNPGVPGPFIPCQPAPPVDMAALRAIALQAAQTVFAGMGVQAINIGIVPEPAVPVAHTGLIGMPVWLWANNPTDSTVGPMSRYATVGVAEVWLTGYLTSVLFSLGDGGIPITCPQPALFTPYVDVAMNLPSPTCGNPLGFAKTSIHEPGGMFTVSATSAWVIPWAARVNGVVFTGTFFASPTSTTQVRVGEVQVLNAPPPPR